MESITTEADYDEALKTVLALMHAQEGSEDAERLEYWSKLVEAYEDEHYPIPMPTPVQAIEFAMDQQGLTRRDLEPFIGSADVVSLVLAGKRRLTLDMARALHAGLGIPFDTLAYGKGVDPMKIGFRTSPALAVFLLAVGLSTPAHAQHASVYGPSGAYMGYVVVTPNMPPGAIPEATAAGMSTANVKCGDELPKDQYRKFMPAGMEPAPGLGICEGMRRMER